MTDYQRQSKPNASNSLSSLKFLGVHLIYWILAIFGSLIAFLDDSIPVAIVSFAFGVAGGILGAVIGNKIRVYTHPNAILTSGIADTFKQRIFWQIGPQLIGVIAGVLIGLVIGVMVCTWLGLASATG